MIPQSQIIETKHIIDSTLKSVEPNGSLEELFAYRNAVLLCAVLSNQKAIMNELNEIREQMPWQPSFRSGPG